MGGDGQNCATNAQKYVLVQTLTWKHRLNWCKTVRTEIARVFSRMNIPESLKYIWKINISQYIFIERMIDQEPTLQFSLSQFKLWTYRSIIILWRGGSSHFFCWHMFFLPPNPPMGLALKLQTIPSSLTRVLHDARTPAHIVAPPF